jgi:glycosyltransferase involved in cell wall biosynthesis
MPGLDPANGDIVYTEGLLKHPPPGVDFETYPDALKSGRLREFGRRGELLEASGPARLPALGRVVRERGINELRQRGMLFREPFRFFSVEPGVYDLVHCHVFSAAFRDLDVPLVMGGSAVIEELYRGAVGWTERRVSLASRADALLARCLGVQHTSHAMPQASVVVCQTQALRNELLRRRSAEPERLRLAPCFVEAGPRIAGRERPNQIGFVAGAFEAKGGDQVLRAFELVRQERNDVELTVIGSEPPSDYARLRALGVTWYPRVSRAELLDTHMPAMDVFAYPTNFDGLPLTVLEVMARGIPVATNDYQAMPEIVGNGVAGSVTPQGDVPALASALLRLLDRDENARVRRLAADWFDAHYAPDVAIAQLSGAYEAALSFSRT